MTTVIWIIVTIVILAVAAVVAFKGGETHELHKTRAAFEHYKEAHKAVKTLSSEQVDEILDEVEKS